MIDFSKIEQYRENNRIEAKKALGGLPKSIWETYSAFANTHGGIILLGVEEWADKSLHTVDLPDPDRLIKEFWDIVNNPNKTSVNVLSSKDVFVQEVDGNHIVVINVPRAERSYKPVYVDGNPLCTYRRNGEGDYRCTKEEYQAIVRDASVKTQDMLVLNEMDLTVFNKESIRSYRQRMRLSRPGHLWEALEDEDFLLKLGAVGIGSDGKKHPTSAGLLMFGNEYDIVREFNTYFLDYQEQYDADTRWTDRIISSSGDWSGNVYDFYFRVYNKLIQDIKVPFKMDGGTRVDDSLMDSVYDERLKKAFEELEELRAQANRLDTRFKTNEEKLIKAGGEKARELQERIEELIRLISIARDELERIESKDENDASLTEENNLHKADQKFKYYEQEIAKATRTNTALRKKELVDSLVNEIKLQATTALKQEIVRKTNEKLRRVIVDDYVEIESIDRYIKLKGRDGASEGQTLSIAYCFLGTLFEDSELEFPFIIDSPTGKMDFEKRQAVADIIPLVFNQMIAFVQSAEVERFADRFYANPDSQYLTVVASPQDQAVVVYEGIDFFDSYQREHKGDEK